MFYQIINTRRWIFAGLNADCARQLYFTAEMISGHKRDYLK